MPPEPSDPGALHDMVKAGETVVRYISGKTREEFESNEMLRDAVERRIEIIGEAARRISQHLQDANPQSPLRKSVATRHVLAHDYDEVNNDVVWRIATFYVPEMLSLIKPLLPAPPPDPDPEAEPQ